MKGYRIIPTWYIITTMSDFGTTEEMYVTKRCGEREIVSFDKILKRIKTLGQEVGLKMNYTSLVMKVIDQLYDGISTTKIDELSAEQCASMASVHPDYNILAGRIVVSNHHKNTKSSFSEVISELYNNYDKDGKHNPLVTEEFTEVVNKYAEKLDNLCNCERDYLIDYFGFKTLERAYLMKIDGITVERPQYMWLRVSIGIHGDNYDKIVETYDYMSQKYFTHATPTLFNAGTPHPQLSSCFLLAMESDSMEGIYSTLKDCAMISKWAGGIGLHIHNVRASGSKIRGTNGESTGIVPMLRVFNNTAKYVNQGGKRNGSFAVYIEPWHADIEVFLQMRKNHGDEELKARDLFYALWIPDLFMERVKTDGDWTLMCPDECRGLADVYGDEFNALYTKYETEGKGRVTMSARKLWFQILDAQMETGTPYLCYKDAANKKSNQQNVGVIKSSNLCVAPETLLLTDNGHMEIHKLRGQTVNVWNGEEFSSVEIVQTGKDQELIDIETDDGCILTCTPYHKFFIQKTYSKNSIETVEAKSLKEGDKLIKCEYPIIEGKDKMLYPYTHGFFCGDGTYSTKSSVGEQRNPGVTPILQLPLDIEEKFFVPMTHSVNTKLDWFSGYCDADGTIANNQDNKQLQVSSINKEFLLNIKLMLQTCGINPKVKKMRDAGTSVLPDGQGGTKHYNTQPVYRLLITSFDLDKLVKLGFSPKRLDITSISLPNRSANHFIKIKSIKDCGRKDDTYCFTEPKKHSGIFNGIITSQCSEIIEYSDENETAVCNLASIALPMFVNAKSKMIDYEKLHEVTKVVTYNLNRIIDVNYYPTEKTKRSNMRHRPIGIGIQGLADVFMMLKIPFCSEEAKTINRNIFETIYHGALEQSCIMAALDKPYETYHGSPASKRKLQFDLWGVTPSNRYDWDELKLDIQHLGLRNSLLLAPMPTASTSQILGYNECIEPITSNIYNRRTLAGEFILANKYLMNDLIELGLWNETIKNNIIANHGSIQHIDVIPQEIRECYKTVWEIPMKQLIDMAADRGAYICQSQSLNLWLEDPNYNNLTSMHFYAWSKGLKTGIYYLRRRARHQAQQFTIEPEKKEMKENQKYEDSEEICEMCSA